MRQKVLSYIFLFTLLNLYLFPPSDILAYATNMNASIVLGQADFTSTSANRSGSVAASSLDYPHDIATNGTRLFVVDRDNHRVLIWNNLPASGQSADVVVGQPNMTSNSANQGGSVAANTLNQPYGVTIADNKLIISDAGNDRILIYNQIPTSNNASADVVIGQSNMTTAVAGASSQALASPFGVFYHSSGKLVVTDWGNSRVMIYNSVPVSNHQAADVVVGHPNMDTSFSGSDTLDTLFLPTKAKIFDNKLLIADDSNCRILIFNSIPSTNGASADVVVGQPGPIGCDEWSASANGFTGGTDMFFDGVRFFAVDNFSSRILIFSNGIPTSNFASADMVLGQPDMTSDEINQGTSANANTLNNPYGGITLLENKLFVADSGNNRVVVYEAFYTVSNLPEGLSAQVITNDNQDPTLTSQANQETTRILESGVPVADLETYYNNDFNWSGLTADTDLDLGIAVIDVSDVELGTDSPHTLYIPSNGQSAVRICPQASSIEQVSRDCDGGVDFSGPFPQTKSVGSDSVTVSIVVINELEFFKATGLTGTGGLSFNDVTSNNTFQEHNLGHSFSVATPPSCSQVAPSEAPQIFAIERHGATATVFFVPVKDNTTEYFLSFGHESGDFRYGTVFSQGNISFWQSHTVNYLDPQKNYSFTIRAGNGCATGPWSDWQTSLTH